MKLILELRFLLESLVILEKMINKFQLMYCFSITFIHDPFLIIIFANYQVLNEAVFFQEPQDF